MLQKQHSYALSFLVTDNLDKKVAAVVDHVKNSGAQKLYGLGFCW